MNQKANGLDDAVELNRSAWMTGAEQVLGEAREHAAGDESRLRQSDSQQYLDEPGGLLGVHDVDELLLVE